jgi:hypothetical protein
MASGVGLKSFNQEMMAFFGDLATVDDQNA